MCIYLYLWIKYLWKDTANSEWLWNKIRQLEWVGHIFHCTIWIYQVHVLHFQLKSELKFPVRIMRKTPPRYAFLCFSCPFYKSQLKSHFIWEIFPVNTSLISWSPFSSELLWQLYFSIAWHTTVLCIMSVLLPVFEIMSHDYIPLNAHYASYSINIRLLEALYICLPSPHLGSATEIATTLSWLSVAYSLIEISLFPHFNHWEFS